MSELLDVVLRAVRDVDALAPEPMTICVWSMIPEGKAYEVRDGVERAWFMARSTWRGVEAAATPKRTAVPGFGGVPVLDLDDHDERDVRPGRLKNLFARKMLAAMAAAYDERERQPNTESDG